MTPRKGKSTKRKPLLPSLSMNQIRGIKEGKSWVGDGKNFLAAPRPGCSKEYIEFYNSKIR